MLENFEKHLNDYRELILKHKKINEELEEIRHEESHLKCKEEDLIEEIRELRKTLRAVGERCGFGSEKTQGFIRKASRIKP